MALDTSILITQFSKFIAFIHECDKSDDPISFRDKNGFLGREEDYKSRIAEDARKELKLENWNENWIGTGKIAGCVSNAMGKAGNLVNSYQQIKFKDRIKTPSIEDEKALYDLYCGNSGKEAFERICALFGYNYSVAAYLFFIKDDTRFLPLSPNNFDRSFKILEIDHRMSRHCSWDNYQTFIRIIRDILEMMRDKMPLQGSLRLIDAHSFVWVIGENRFINWIPSPENQVMIETTAENMINGKHQITSQVYSRSAEVVKITRQRAAGICQYCGRQAPFNDIHGNPYLEVHHVKWLSRGGTDSTDNTVALCPNCHARMHVLDLAADVEKLKHPDTMTEMDN